jgi:hypothetical protein
MQQLWWQRRRHQKHLDIGHDDNNGKGGAMVEDRTNANKGGSIATNVLNDCWGCQFLRVATKAISNGKDDADDNLQDNAATNIFSNVVGIDGH